MKLSTIILVIVIVALAVPGPLGEAAQALIASVAQAISAAAQG